MADLELSQTGRLYSYSIVHSGPKGFRTPYAVGYVDLPEGVRVFAPLTETEGLELDGPMELTWGPVGESEDGRTLMTFVFRPSRGGLPDGQ